MVSIVNPPRWAREFTRSNEQAVQEDGMRTGRMLTAGAVALAAAATAGAAPDYTEIAPVISATPIVERVIEPRQECVQEAVPARERNVVAPLVGGVAGAMLGSQIGRGSGRTAATAAGALAGTVIGDRMANPDSDRPATGALAGGVAGSLLGAQVGSGSGRNAAAAAGAIGGAMIGDRVQNPQMAGGQPVQRCRTVDAPRDIVRGYTVVYRYNGRDVTTTMPYHPGSTVRVAVGIVDGPPAGTPPPPPVGATVVRDAPPATLPPGGYPYQY